MFSVDGISCWTVEDAEVLATDMASLHRKPFDIVRVSDKKIVKTINP